MAIDTQALGALTVLTASKEPLPVRRIWEDQPTVLVWLRHFGCMFCREQAKELTERKAEFDALGVKGAFISTGLPAMVDDFVQTYSVKWPVYVDPRRETYRYLGFKRGLLNTLFNPRTLLNGIRAMRSGARQGKPQGDPWQQGGALVVKKGGEVIYAFASASAGDHPSVNELLDAAKRAADARQGVVVTTAPNPASA